MLTDIQKVRAVRRKLDQGPEEKIIQRVLDLCEMQKWGVVEAYVRNYPEFKEAFWDRIGIESNWENWLRASYLKTILDIFDKQMEVKFVNKDKEGKVTK